MAEWHIVKLVPGGDGMARLEDGRIAFARGGIPGDVLSPGATTAKKGYVRADSFTLVRASPLRVEPPCPIAARCGGCDWMAIERRAQVRQKGAILKEALVRVGRFSELPEEIPVETAGPDLGYRSRVRFHVDGEGKVGFFANRSHELVEVAHCPICRPEVDRALSAIRALPRSALVPFAGVDVRSALDGSAVRIDFEPREGARVPEAALARLSELDSGYSVTIGGRALRKDGTAEAASLSGGSEPLGARVFVQVNADVNAVLVASVVRGARERHVVRFCDLYAGAGNFTLPLLRAGLSGVAVERDANAVRAGRRLAAAAGFEETVFVADTAAHFLAHSDAVRARFDLVFLDPPRRGAKEVLEHVVRLAPRYVAMCSCDPVTFARDLATLRAAGYELGDVRGFDMFPHTHHLEALAWMERREASRRRP